MDSLLENVRMNDLVEEWIAIDDGSDQSELRYIAARYPFLRILANPVKGHALALNRLFAEVATEYVFHFEDDWYFEQPGQHLLQALEIMEHDQSIGVVSLRKFLGDLHSTGRTEYYLHRYGGPGDSPWPGYTLNPSIQRMDRLRMVGAFEDVERFEYAFALRFVKQGNRVAYLKPPPGRVFVRHLGHTSAYVLNMTRR